MSTSLIPTVLANLVTLLDAALSIEVTDGPPGQNSPEDGLFIGATDEDNTIPFAQRWAGQGHIAKDESFEIPNLLYASSGDAGFAEQRTDAFANLALIETVLRSNPTLGISTNALRAQFGTSGEVVQIHGNKGPVCRVRFTINIEGRI